jgi:hypothetical protein
VYNGIILNDPQNDIAPAVHFPSSVVGAVRALGADPRTPAIEGVVRIEELPAPPQRPRTFLELSKGTNELRQRRVHFSSADGPVGLDLSYDELLNDGYSFDARELVGINATEYGKSTSRQYGVRLRGTHDNGDAYSLGLREFSSTFTGDLVSSSREQRRSGHLATVTADMGRLGLRLYERGYAVTYPDSHTVNETTAAAATVRIASGPGFSLLLDAAFEDINATQRVGGAESAPSLSRTTGTLSSVAALGNGLAARAYVCGADYHGYVSQWGGGVGIDGAWERLRVGLDARRSFRMPNLGELFLPAHAVGGRTVAGNRYLDAEYAWEGAGHVGVTLGPFTSETRVTGIRVKDPVVLDYLTRPGGDWLVPVNGGGAALVTIEERVRVSTTLGWLQMHTDAAAMFTEGDRVGFFSSVPRVNTLASFRVGGNLFEATSALFAGVEYLRGGERTGFSGEDLPSYEVFNFFLDGRLLDAQMYLALFNAFDEAYRTEGEFLMTPRTFVYGISWTLWE